MKWEQFINFEHTLRYDACDDLTFEIIRLVYKFANNDQKNRMPTLQMLPIYIRKMQGRKRVYALVLFEQK